MCFRRSCVRVKSMRRPVICGSSSSVCWGASGQTHTPPECPLACRLAPPPSTSPPPPPLSVSHHLISTIVATSFALLRSSVLCLRGSTVTRLFYTIVWSYVCNFNEFVELGLERVRRKKSLADSFTAYAALVGL